MDAAWPDHPCADLGIVTVGVDYTCLGGDLRKISAPNAVTLTFAEPTTAAILATVILHQFIRTTGWLGVTLVLAALNITACGTDTVNHDHHNPAKALTPG